MEIKLREHYGMLIIITNCGENSYMFNMFAVSFFLKTSCEVTEFAYKEAFHFKSVDVFGMQPDH